MVTGVCGYIAMWATRQSPYHAPDGLDGVLRLFQASVSKESCLELHFGSSWLRLDVQCPEAHLRKILQEHLFAIPQVRKWNERKNGNPSPFGFVSRYDRPNPDDDFIDLDAMVRNISQAVMEEYRTDFEKDAYTARLNWPGLLSRLRHKFSKPQSPTV